MPINSGKDLEKHIKRLCKNAERVFQQIGQDGSNGFTRLLREHLANLGREMNRWRNLHVVASAYVSGLCNPSFDSVEEEGSIGAENAGQRYLQMAVGTTPYYGSSHGRFDSVMISAEPVVEKLQTNSST